MQEESGGVLIQRPSTPGRRRNTNSEDGIPLTVTHGHVMEVTVTQTRSTTTSMTEYDLEENVCLTVMSNILSVLAYFFICFRNKRGV